MKEINICLLCVAYSINIAMDFSIFTRDLGQRSCCPSCRCNLSTRRLDGHPDKSGMFVMGVLDIFILFVGQYHIKILGATFIEN